MRSATRGASLIALAEVSGAAELIEWAPGPGRFAFTALRFSGREQQADSMRSNASGMGTQVALRNGSQWTLTDTYKHASSRGQSLQPLAIGLRGSARADFVELRWSDGVFQTELDLASGPIHRLSETQRQLSSCPVLFAWSGSRFDFLTDLLGVGGLGGFVAPEQYATPRPWERLKLEPGTISARDGALIFKLSEPMQESAYLDALRLDYYDLPNDWRVVVDERMATGEPAVSGETLFYRSSADATRAYNSAGEDVRPAIAQRDHHAMSPGEIDPRFIGLLQGRESLTLEFEAPIDRLPGRPAAYPVLVADAWVEYPYSQTVFAAWQAGLEYQSATLEARDARGVWQVIYPEFGYPAGMPGEMTLPLTTLPAGTNGLRLSWGREIYWDRVRIVYAEPPPDTLTRGSRLPRLARAAKTGFPRRTTFAQRRPGYDYQQRAPFWDTEYPSGLYTRLGNVTPLVEASDDALAIIGLGEELHIEFAAGAPPQTGYRRWFVLETRGWAKDMDLYTHQADTVGPLPRANPEIANEQREALHRRYNTRFQAGR